MALTEETIVDQIEALRLDESAEDRTFYRPCLDDEACALIQGHLPEHAPLKAARAAGLQVAADAIYPAQPARWVIGVRRAERILRGGTVVSKTEHRHVLEPGADLSLEDPMVKAVAATVWKR